MKMGEPDLPKQRRAKVRATAVDLFCGAGGLTNGMLISGIPVAAGYDIDPACQFPYEANNGKASFKLKSVSDLTVEELASFYPPGHIRILVGCAPCQPFSKYTQGLDKATDAKWGLLGEFGRLVAELKPEIISMENVPEIQRHSVFTAFIATLEKAGYHVTHQEAFCPDFGIPQKRKRLVLLASLLGPISLVKAPKTSINVTVRDAIAHLPKLQAGEASIDDGMHRACQLSPLNLKRIRASRPGGNWRSWPKHLIAACHREKSGQTYPSVYGRMEWDIPSPTITTQFFGFGNGRFGHPDQDRAITLREGAILQSFPADYKFIPEGQAVSFATLGRLIGNAVPVRLGEAIGYSIHNHLNSLTV
ncbi:DNA cytosine methyltransferase [Herminiimonas fonticola]|uniref:DNA (cytosine-5-)-methyltransferase n=1 Tax=Herminiimonas fonticola TaxID=303380 RepID=A0A4R6GJS6_9BURK|nr:DNA (cytosine-5-)-methyltransferase [Herminiimonas fonticola]RBA25431.1 dcm: DNA (cytosine-5-)-methyltransferase [Herminiimonas fonticola]TDN94544.1 DNA (cytosine-5)-methyltransferase 1 [Herminiimonas fonticola]